MTAVREELHQLVDQLPEDQVPPVLAMLRSSVPPSPRESGLAVLAQVRERMRGVTGVDEELERLRDDIRG